MIDNETRIRRFTPAAARAFSLLPGDIGRPITDLRLNIDIKNLGSTVEKVVTTLVQEEFEGRTILVRNIWSDITADSCRFEQSFSDDGGKTWEVIWIAVDTRVNDEPPPDLAKAIREYERATFRNMVIVAKLRAAYPPRAAIFSYCPSTATHTDLNSLTLDNCVLVVSDSAAVVAIRDSAYGNAFGDTMRFYSRDCLYSLGAKSTAFYSKGNIKCAPRFFGDTYFWRDATLTDTTYKFRGAQTGLDSVSAIFCIRTDRRRAPKTSASR
jgi:hypothetical protein